MTEMNHFMSQFTLYDSENGEFFARTRCSAAKTRIKITKKAVFEVKKIIFGRPPLFSSIQGRNRLLMAEVALESVVGLTGC